MCHPETTRTASDFLSGTELFLSDSGKASRSSQWVELFEFAQDQSSRSDLFVLEGSKQARAQAHVACPGLVLGFTLGKLAALAARNVEVLLTKHFSLLSTRLAEGGMFLRFPKRKTQRVPK